ncbi:MAG: hypothetical protein FH756_12600 [Firmicutes bacterium]|nr:hypothetical protein [Bacillota bacterium]
MANNIQINEYLRESELPHIWCAGCGHGIVLNATARAVAKMDWNKDDVLAVSGIGCFGRMPVYTDFNGVQTTHGRALAFATGMKVHRPDMNVFVFSGDGDCAGIGGNHFLHAAKRNIDMTVIVMNNYIYGMTGGQGSPTTPHNSMTTTTPYGNIEAELDICEVAKAAGATFVARTTAYHVNQLAGYIEKGFRNKGFSVIECIDPCTTGYGRRNKFKKPVDMYKYLKSNSISLDKSKDLSEEELEGKIVTGIFKDVRKREYCNEYDKMAKQVRENAKEEVPLEMVPEVPEAENLKRCEFRLSGSGGQGLILAGIMLAEAGIRQGKKAVQSQSYGVEARGGASRSEVILGDEDINFPEVICPDVLLTMNQESCDKFATDIKSGGIILADSTYVDNIPEGDAKVYKAPITQLAIDKIGNAVVANVVALGVLARVCGFIAPEGLKKAILSRVPAKAMDLNIKAFEEGYNYGEQLLTD